ncbi:MAG: trimethylamine methyltransferase family protein [Candidatus Bathyarchaeia archaeon]
MYKVLDSAEIYSIHSSAMEVLERVGVLIENDFILDLLKRVGAEVDGKTKIARFAEYLIKDKVTKVPSNFTLYSRSGQKLRVGKKRPLVIPSANATRILDIQSREPRPATKEDVEQTCKLSDALEHTDICSPSVLPQDVEPELMDIYAAEGMMRNSSKPYFLAPSDEEQASYIIEMAAIVAGGMIELEKEPIITIFVSPTSPLRLGIRELEIARRSVKHNIPIFVAPCPNSGVTSPISLAGTLVLICAEYLALTFIVELLNPGNPVVIGGAPGITDMRTGNISYASVETALMGAAIAQIGSFYHLPSYAATSDTGSFELDAQAGYETAWTTIMPIIAGIDLVIAPGHLGAYTIASYEKLVMDNEILGAIKRILKGIDISDTALAVDVIEAVGPKGHFLAQKHTREHYTKERWMPKISNRIGFSDWSKEKLNLWDRAKREAVEILRTHQPEPLERDREEGIRNILKKASKRARSA